MAVIHFPNNLDLNVKYSMSHIKLGYIIYQHKIRPDMWVYDKDDSKASRLPEYKVLTVVELSEDEIWVE